MTSHVLPSRYSGIYPHLAVTNDGTTECGIGAVAAWKGSLWFMTYPASGYKGDDNKLYQLDENLQLTVRPESVGGTHANRFVHKETGQLIIGLYFIDQKGVVRSLDPNILRGRMTGVGRHLSDPENKVYLNTMEDGMYEIDVHTLAWQRLRRDKLEEFAECMRLHTRIDPAVRLPGSHGKGGYSGQGHFFFTNNGNGGVLAEWNGLGDAQLTSSWKIIDRNKYTEVTGPGGLQGPRDNQSVIWALGWDNKSVLLNVRMNDTWQIYRLPKASYTQDADHGWYTEWPRIRELPGYAYLMCMHGALYTFPPNFAPYTTAGIRPISRHLKMIIDFEAWNGQLVFACDDASMFGNPQLGRQQSNLWFATADDLEKMGKPAGWCGIWQHENLMGDLASDPIFFAGFARRVLHIRNGHYSLVRFQVEADFSGDGRWRVIDHLDVPSLNYAYLVFPDELKAEWIRVRPLNDASDVSASLDFLPETHASCDPGLIAGLVRPGRKDKPELLYVTEHKDMTLQLMTDDGIYTIGSDLQLDPTESGEWAPEVQERLKLDTPYTVDQASVLLIDDEGRRFRLPKGHASVDGQAERCIREVVTERSLLNACGTFYELPRAGSGGIQRMKPITSHNLHIHDFASWRGLLVLSGVDPSQAGEHCIISTDGKTGIWLGNVDDLWRFGAPGGKGGPCYQTDMTAGVPSDPYLMACYIHKKVVLSHDADHDVQFSLQVDFQADDTWSCYASITVPPGQEVTHVFPDGYSAHWVRVRISHTCRATAVFHYS